MKKNDDLVTKRYLDKKLKVFRSEMREELVGMKDEINNNMYKFKDEIIGEFKKHDENNEVHKFSHVRIDEELEDYDRRISQLAAA